MHAMLAHALLKVQRGGFGRKAWNVESVFFCFMVTLWLSSVIEAPAWPELLSLSGLILCKYSCLLPLKGGNLPSLVGRRFSRVPAIGQGWGWVVRARELTAPVCKELREPWGFLFQICLYSCFQMKMVEKCGCAQYSQPLPPAANYCNYQQHPNWSECHPFPACHAPTAD